MDQALRPLAPGKLLHIGSRALEVSVSPRAGGRIAQASCDGVGWLCGPGTEQNAAIAWGCYPMLPWAGRLRNGQLRFQDHDYQLPLNLGAHAIHGVGFTLPWSVLTTTSSGIELALQLPADERWPFGGVVHQAIRVEDRRLRLALSLVAGRQPMPRPVLGWHPWFRKPERLEFSPARHFLRDEAGIATTTHPGMPPAPWDDCFINTRPILLHRAGQSLRLTSDCDHWVVFDERSQTTCVEPQSGPPDAFNLRPGQTLAPGESMAAWFELQWL